MQKFDNFSRKTFTKEAPENKTKEGVVDQEHSHQNNDKNTRSSVQYSLFNANIPHETRASDADEDTDASPMDSNPGFIRASGSDMDISTQLNFYLELFQNSIDEKVDPWFL